MVEARGWAEKFEKWSRMIPGMKGYQDKEAFRDADKAVRVKVSEKLTAAKQTLDAWKRDVIDGGSIKGLDVIDRSVRRVEGLADRIRYDAYGYSGYFDAAKIREPELNQLYQFDLGLFDQVDTIQKAIEAAKAGGAGDIKTSAKAVEKAIDDLEKLLNDRKSFSPEKPAGA